MHNNLTKETPLQSFHRPINRLGVLLLSIEALILIASFYVGVAVRFSPLGHLHFDRVPDLLPQAVVFASVMILSMQFMGMYHLTHREDMRHTLLRLMPSFTMGFGLISLIVYIAPIAYFGRGIVLIVMILATLGVLLTRSIYCSNYVLNLLRPNILILGAGELANECAHTGGSAKNPIRFKVVGFAPLHEGKTVVDKDKILPADQSLMSLVTTHQVDEIVVAIQQRDNKHFPIQQLLECKLNGITVVDASTFFEREMNHIRVNSLHPSWLVFGGGFDQSALRAAIKRVFDLISSITLLVITLPVMLIATLCILLEDGGPVLYRQERIGLEGRPFTVYKFRSMRKDAEKSGKPQWATQNDSRITRVGNIIRTLRIDELPQIFNVLKGEMSLVGPRPERDFFVRQLCEQIPYYNLRHSIKPGVTGWAQVRYQYGSSVEDSLQKLQYDLYYVKNNNLFLDIVILMDTVWVVLTGKGSR
ncbi:MAG: TIGR03013 family PEP-CTERM/XrtA system glycosyltransferase [Gallionella sp.]|nr:TIGR03013 family PEP-CTERM/XrtA system glycosyltransferase [Gallionella sp.]MDD4945579.1 TIGR03013 family PEP-CTERM/XrtA system glycosyltransferase [Gallionella sp.]MDD5612095.1 TIGR03013 family PEP-CTERM/XrtA system glycosyltransferase [Gallionella sp.]